MCLGAFWCSGRHAVRRRVSPHMTRMDLEWLRRFVDSIVLLRHVPVPVDLDPRLQESAGSCNDGRLKWWPLWSQTSFLVTLLTGWCIGAVKTVARNPERWPTTLGYSTRPPLLDALLIWLWKSRVLCFLSPARSDAPKPRGGTEWWGSCYSPHAYSDHTRFYRSLLRCVCYYNWPDFYVPSFWFGLVLVTMIVLHFCCKS